MILPLPSSRAGRWPVALVLAFAVVAATSAAPRITRTLTGDEPYETFNHHGPAAWPASIRRIVVVPAHDISRSIPARTLQRYDAVWLNALQLTQRAECVPLDRRQLQTDWGRPSFNSTTPLPAGWLAELAKDTDAEAVLFLDLSTVQSQPPMILAFRAKLVRLADGEIIWATDEVWDSRNRRTLAALKDFQKDMISRSPVGDSSIALTQSPSLFASCAFAATLRALPARPLGDFR